MFQCFCSCCCCWACTCTASIFMNPNYRQLLKTISIPRLRSCLLQLGTVSRTEAADASHDWIIVHWHFFICRTIEISDNGVLTEKMSKQKPLAECLFLAIFVMTRKNSLAASTTTSPGISVSATLGHIKLLVFSWRQLRCCPTRGTGAPVGVNDKLDW